MPTGSSWYRGIGWTTSSQAIEVAERLGWNVVLKATARGCSWATRSGQRASQSRPPLKRWLRRGTDLTPVGSRPRVGWRLTGRQLPNPVVQAMAPPGVALVITSREDAAFGPIVSLGLGRDSPASCWATTVYRVPPLTTVDAAAMVRDLRAAPTLFGHNGRLGVDVEAIEDLLHRIAQLADDLPQLAVAPP